jgi:predicted transposase/invertase (TIGR01784 family)
VKGGVVVKYLDPKNDLMFKKVFGENKHLCISLLNSLLKFEGGARIESIEYDTTELIPEIPAFKDTIVDVRCKDKNGREFIVEMQMNWTNDFEQRVVFNASKVYVKQVKKGDEIILAQPVYSLNLINDIFDRDPKMKEVYYHHYKIVNIEHTEKQIKGLEFVFIELPKFKRLNSEERAYFDLWLRFLTEINEDTRDIPSAFLENAELRDAMKCVEEASLSEDELKVYDKVQDAIWAKQLLMNGKRKEGFEEGEAKGKAEGIKEGEAKGIKEGEAKGKVEGETRAKTEMAKAMKAKGFDVKTISEITKLPESEISRL